MATQLQIRRDTAADLAGVTPAQAEPIYDQTNKKFGIGDGTSIGSAAALYAVMNRDLHKMAPIAAVAGGTANALTVTLDPAPAAYVAFMTVLVKASAPNTSTTTINVNGLGAKTVKKNGGAADLAGGDFVTGGIYLLLYDGTNFQMISGGAGGNKIAQVVESITSADFSITATIPADATIPQIGEGTEVLTRTITPTNASSTFLLHAELFTTHSAASSQCQAALFTDANANAVASAQVSAENPAILEPLIFTHILAAFGDVSSHTIRLRAGPAGGTQYVNRTNGVADLFSTSLNARLRVTEILP